MQLIRWVSTVLFPCVIATEIVFSYNMLAPPAGCSQFCTSSRGWAGGSFLIFEDEAVFLFSSDSYKRCCSYMLPSLSHTLIRERGNHAARHTNNTDSCSRLQTGSHSSTAIQGLPRGRFRNSCQGQGGLCLFTFHYLLQMMPPGYNFSVVWSEK